MQLLFHLRYYFVSLFYRDVVKDKVTHTMNFTNEAFYVRHLEKTFKSLKQPKNTCTERPEKEIKRNEGENRLI